MHYWIIVASKDHLQRGLAGGFIQSNHGKAASLKRMHAEDFRLKAEKMVGTQRLLE